MNKAVFFALLVSPIFYSGLLAESDIRTQQFFVLLVFTALFLGATHFNRIIGYALIFCIAHLALFQRENYLNSLSQIMAHLLIYDIVARHYKGRNYKYPFLAILALNLFMAGLQYFKQDVFLHMDLQSPGLMTLPVYIGIYAAITAPIIATIHPTLLILSIAGVVVSRSSFAAVAFVVAISFYLWQAKSKLFKFFVPAVLCGLVYFVGFYDGPTGQFSRRVHVWKMVGSAIAVNPFGGWGLGSYNSHISFAEIGNSEKCRQYATYQSAKPEHAALLDEKIYQVAVCEFGETKAKELFLAQSTKEMVEWFRKNGSDFYVWADCHNEYLLVLFELGIFGFGFIIWYLFDISKRFFYWRKMRTIFNEQISIFSSLIALVIVSAAHFPMGVARISFTAVFLLAVLDARLKQIEA